MKKLSETLTELGIAFTFPIKIKDANGNVTYYENSNDYWYRYERDRYDANGTVTYYEDSEGFKRGTPKSAKTCEGKVVEVDGVKYKLTAL
jgi:hypothetical protein